MVHVILIFPMLEKKVECFLAEELGFRENLRLLAPLLASSMHHRYALNRETRVFAAMGFQACDMDVPLFLLHVEDGMRFLVF